MKRLAYIFIAILTSVVMVTAGSGVLYAECMKSHKQHIVLGSENMECQEADCLNEQEHADAFCSGDCLVYHYLKTSDYTQQTAQQIVPSAPCLDLMLPSLMDLEAPATAYQLSHPLHAELYPPGPPRDYLSKISVLIV